MNLIIDKAKRQLQTVANTLDETGTRTKAIERRLRGVEALPDSESREPLNGDLSLD